VPMEVMAAGGGLLGLEVGVVREPRINARARAGQDRVPSLPQEELNVAFRLVVIALTEVGVPDLPVLVDQVLRRPVLVLVGVPRLPPPVNCNRPVHAVMREGLPSVG